jgi:hypothetical protein
MGVRTPFYFVICVDDDEENIESLPPPAMDADLYNYYYDDDDEDDHDDGVYSTSSSCHEYNDNSSILDDIDSVYGEDLDECDFDLDFPSYSKREMLPFQQSNSTVPESDEYYIDYEDDEYSLPAEEWEEVINDARQEADETSTLLVDKQQPRRRHDRHETNSPAVL